MKKIVTLMNCLCIALGCIICFCSCGDEDSDIITEDPVSTGKVIAEGKCGGCVWSINGEGLLTIKPGRASGLLAWVGDDTPWADYVDNIYAIKVEKGTVAQTCRGLFANCSAATSIDISGLNTENVTDMHSMFRWCYSLRSIDLSRLNTSNVKEMDYMFAGCTDLESIDVSNFDTRNVERMSYMFALCRKVKHLELNNFDTRNVIAMDCMFRSMDECVSIDVKSFNTAKVETMYEMFSGCYRLEDIDLSGFETSNVCSFERMFYGCNHIKTCDMHQFSFVKAQTVNDMFADSRFFEMIIPNDFCVNEVGRELDLGNADCLLVYVREDKYEVYANPDVFMKYARKYGTGAYYLLENWEGDHADKVGEHSPVMREL